MIALVTNTPQFRNELCEVIRIFFPGEIIEDADETADCLSARVDAARQAGNVTAVARIGGRARAEGAFAERDEQGDDLQQKRQLKHAAKIALYRALSRVSGARAPWGSLTGIRPTKFARELTLRYGEQGARTLLLEKYDVSGAKADLALGIAARQRSILAQAQGADVYIGVPFCRSRCLYCSFASEEYNKTGRVREYLGTLKEEIRGSAALLAGAGIRARCLYVGGGTPTALSCDELEGLLQTALDGFGGCLREFTVEAGRPDTIDTPKLRMLRRMGVTRVSINPQSMNQSTLDAIGRSHTVGELIEKFYEARACGFDCVNMDVIAGLPGENAAMFADTMRWIERLSPANVTVHTLAVKRSSRLKSRLHEIRLPPADETAAMLEEARAVTERMGLLPYYLYRQKYMSGNLENVGYARPGTECLYNIDIMEEQTSVLALGSGGITKWVAGGRIERQANPKDLATYTGKIHAIIKEKSQMIGRCGQ